jgi:hypothetical protein
MEISKQGGLPKKIKLSEILEKMKSFQKDLNDINRMLITFLDQNYA